MNKNYLIVTSILEGRYFPSRQGCDVVIEASFDGEVLTTDPVPHSCHPNFNTELAWGVDRRGLHVHKLHRTPVKLQCFVVERSSKKKDRVGYVVLDIRGIPEGGRSAKWHPLLNSKYHGAKPEIHVGLHLEEDTVPDTPSLATSEPARTDVRMQRVVVQPADPAADTDLSPCLNLRDGCYDIGRHPTALYVFTVTIAFAANLKHLQENPENRPLTGRGGQYHFIYHLLGHEVSTESFPSLENPEFPAERASLRIRSSGPVLRRFFAAHPTLQVQLASDDSVIAETEIPLGDFSASSPDFSVSVQGLFQLCPVPHNEDLMSRIAPEYRPIVGVYVEISEKEAIGGTANETDGRQEEPLSEQPPAPSPPPPAPAAAAGRGESPHPAPRSRSRDSRPRTPTQLLPERSPTQRPRRQLDFSPPQKLGRAENRRPTADAASSQPGDFRPAQSSSCPRVPEDAAPSQQPEVIDLTDQIDEEQFHHLSLMLDIRSLNVLSTRGKPMQCYVRYHYPFLGTSHAFQSHKWTSVVPNLNATVVGGFSTYNFAATLKMVALAFKELPLMVEIFSQAEGGDKLFGTAEVSLASVLRCPASSLLKDNGVTGERRMQTSKISIMDPRGKVIGELQAVVCLDDLGITSLPPRDPPSHLADAANKPAPVQAASESQEREILKVMTELELWKEQQEIMFRARLKEKEDAHLRALTEEWKRQDFERDTVLRRKIKENKELEEKLRSHLKEIESREEAHARREAQFEKQKSEFQFMKTRLQKEAKETLRRSLEEYEHMLNIEKKKVLELEAEKHKLKRQISELEAKLQERERQFEELKTSQRDAFSQELKVQIDYEKALTEKVQLLKELQEALRLKEQYREKCNQAESQLAAYKQRVRQTQQQELQDRHDEVERLYQQAKARYERGSAAMATSEHSQPLSAPDEGASFTTPEKTSPTHYAPTVEAMRERLGGSQLSGASFQPSRHDASSPVVLEQSPPGASAASTSSWMEHMRRLIEERDTLLKSGVYSKEDVIIVELNRRIADIVRKHV
ncbi:centrosomal protein of 120 kDa [Rhipicephalus microplus]|uniref:centrosomal protein of 120 kDa n=1 Tax=Rhipicephalus microplus TaxID=6941 RepID=UPI003F6BB96C